MVLASGVFDVLHYGHVKHLEYARKLGSRLVVGLTTDSKVNKGPKRPVFSEIRRKYVLEQLRCVSEVRIVDNSFQALHLVRPDIYVKGKEYEGKLLKAEVEFCKEQDIEIVFTDLDTYSTTKILQHAS